MYVCAYLIYVCGSCRWLGCVSRAIASNFTPTIALNVVCGTDGLYAAVCSKKSISTTFIGKKVYQMDAPEVFNVAFPDPCLTPASALAGGSLPTASLTAASALAGGRADSFEATRHPDIHLLRKAVFAVHREDKDFSHLSRSYFCIGLIPSSDSFAGTIGCCSKTSSRKTWSTTKDL